MLSWIKNTSFRYAALIVFSFIANESTAKVVLPDMLSDNMVLQQNSYIKLWGIAKPNKCVKIRTSWSDKEYKYCTKKDGSFLISVKTPNASLTAHSIAFQEGKSITRISNILIGEVWFCSGQSNMEMTLKGFNNQPIENSEKVISDANPNNGVRMLKVKRIGQEAPSKTAEGKWLLSTPQNVTNFSAVAYFFALKMRKELNIPIGIINSSWGGSSVEGWMNKDLVDNYTDLDLKQEIPDNENWKKPCIMYNGMINPFTDYIVKGFIWYQGESNIDRYATYADKLKDMVTLWRYEWGLGNLPFYIVEIAPFIYDNPVNPAKLREAQYKASTMIENTGFISTNDLVGPDESKIVHPKLKQPIGERLANTTLKQTYFKDSICADFAALDFIEIKDEKALITFKKTAGGLDIENLHGIYTDSLNGFEIAGNDHIFYPGIASFQLSELNSPDRVEVSSALVPNPLAVRYSFKSYSVGNIRNGCELPLIPFRTDNWEE